MQISDGVKMEPYLKKIHEDFSAWGIGFKKLICLYFPLFSELVGDLLHENGVLIESILILLIFKEGKIGVIENLVLLFPHEIVFGFLGRKGFAPACIIFALHFAWRSF